MNIAILGSNNLADALTQRFTKQGHTIHTMGSQDPTDWPREATDLKNKQLDLIIGTSLIPQLWRELHHALKNTGVPMLIPSPNVSWLEWSKVDAKALLKRVGVPSPKHEEITYQEALDTFKTAPRPYVLKYDEEYREGLQTIIITDDNVDKEYDLFVKHGRQKVSTGLTQKDNEWFVREQFVQGKEYSYHVLCNGTECTFLGSARDYKKRYEGDIGHNTVGMGAYSPVDYTNHIALEYAQRIVGYLNSIGLEYIGIMYLGMIVNDDGHSVLEINTRFGDPEFSAILPTIDSDLAQSFIEAATRQPLTPITFNETNAVCLRLVHKDYSVFEKVGVKYPTFTNLPDNIQLTNSSGFINFGPMLTTTNGASILHEYIQTIDLGDFTYRKDVGYLK